MTEESLTPWGPILGWCLLDGFGTDSARVMARALVWCVDSAALEESEWSRPDDERRAWLRAAVDGLDRGRGALEPEILDLLRRLYGPDR